MAPPVNSERMTIIPVARLRLAVTLLLCLATAGCGAVRRPPPQVDRGAEPSPEEMTDYVEFGEAAGDAILGGEALQSPTTATTVRVKGGKGGDILTSDG